MRPWRVYLRSVQGQLLLLGVAFAGAAVLAIIPRFFRDRIFEYYCREGYPPMDGAAEKAVQVLNRPGATNEQIVEVIDELRKRKGTVGPSVEYPGLERVYGSWIEDAGTRESGLVARRLTGSDRSWLREWTLNRLRTTLVTGNVEQREAAVEWIEAALGDEELKDETRAELRVLLEHARARALRRGEAGLASRAGTVLSRGR